jgi:hypothetical protein
MVDEEGSCMKCPACENDVPSGLSACTSCGAPLPSAGERFGPEPRFASAPMTNPKTEPPNPKTEPFAMPAWDMGEERPWDLPSERHAAPGNTMPPGPATRNLGAPAAHPRPLEHDAATQNLATPAAGPMPPEQNRDPWHFGTPGTPGTDAMTAGPDPATQHLGAPGPGPIPPLGHDPAGWNPGFPPAAGETAEPPAGDRTGKNPRRLLLAGGIAAVVVLGGGLAYVLTQGLSGSDHETRTSAGSPGAGSTAQQAAAVNQVLKSGKAARGHLPSRLKTCDDVSAGVSGFQQVVRDRQQELSQSKGLKVDRLRDGSRLRRSMIDAYQSSLDADQAYLAWAQDVRAKGCGGKIAPLTAHYKRAISANGKAGPAKRQVVALWKPIASDNHLPTYVWNRL